jgi:hypothetical protein
MPKVLAKVLAVKQDGDKLLAKLQFNGKLPSTGENVTVKWGATRSTSQNSLYWVFLQWLIDNGMRDMGHYSADALHLDFKAHFLSEKRFDKGQIKAIEEGSTTQLNKVEFGQYMDQVNLLAIELGIETEPFWKEYGNTYAV